MRGMRGRGRAPKVVAKGLDTLGALLSNLRQLQDPRVGNEMQ